MSRKRRGEAEASPPLYKCPACDKTGTYSEMIDHAIWDHGIGFEYLKEVSTHEGDPIIQPA